MNIKLHKIKEIFSFNNTSPQSKSIIHGQYPHIVQDKIYWQSRLNNSFVSVEYATIENDSVVMSKEGTVLTKSLACQNFRVFYDDNPATPFDEKWKAIGGYHVGRSSIKITNPTKEQIINSPLHQELTGCKVSESASIRTLQDVVWKSETKLLFTDDDPHPRHANGLYVFKSKDGIKWKNYHPAPVLSAFTPCKDEVSFNFDTMPSIFYDHNNSEYVLYSRSNIKLGVRHVLCSTSKDLITWSVPKLIKKNPEFLFSCENLYYMGAYRLPGTKKYIAFPAHFKNDILNADGSQRRYYDAKTLVMISDDKYNWDVKAEIFLDFSNGHLTQPHVVSFRKEEEKYIIYVHEGFMTGQSKLVKYSIELGEIK